MALDIAITEDRETTWNGNGDFTKDSGDDELAQSFIISIIENVDLVVATLQPSDIESKGADIRDAVANNPRSREPITVNGRIETDDSGTQYVEYDVQTASVSLTVETQ